MEFRGVAESSQNHDEQKIPLIGDASAPETEQKTLKHKALGQTFQSTAQLANHLPTGTVLAFQLLSPVFTKQGNCNSVGQSLTVTLLAVCGLSCFLSCFTDSFRDQKGNVCHGFATYHGLWVIDASEKISPEFAAKYRLQFVDWMHAFMSVFSFAAIALCNRNVIHCFCPAQSADIHMLITALPVGISVVCSVLFAAFPTKRCGIGFSHSVN